MKVQTYDTFPDTSTAMKSSTRDTFLVFGAPSLEDKEIQEVLETLRSGWIGTGPRVERFEKEFARYKEAPQAVAVSSCTAALHLSFIAAEFEPGDEVITTANTFCATVNAMIHAGAKPVLVDIDPRTWNMDVSLIEQAITPRTRAICPVHYAGLPCDMAEIKRLAEKYSLLLIEDCAHAVETRYRGRNAGTFGDFGCFSFYVTKNVITAEGGMVLTRHEDQASRLRVLALHGMTKDAWQRFGDSGYKHYEVVEAGFKYNMTDIQAALGIHQLERVERNWEKRRVLWRAYSERLKDLPVGLPVDAGPEDRHAYHLFPIRVSGRYSGLSRDDFLDRMAERNIGVGVHYLSIPEHRFYQDRFGWRPEMFPNAMSYGRETVSLPLSPNVTLKDVDDVVDAIEDIVSE